MTTSGAQPRSGLSPAQIALAKQILNTVVMHERYAKALRSALDIVTRSTELRMPAGMLMMSEPGMGKSLLLNLVKQRLKAFNEPMDGQAGRPVLHVELDCMVDTHKLAAKMMTVLGYPNLPSRRNLEQTTALIDDALAVSRPIALMVDEGQHMCEGNRTITAHSLTDWIKVRMDKHNLPVLIFGTKTLMRLSDINPQFTTRACTLHEIQSFEFDQEWMQMLGGLVQGIDRLDMYALLHQPVSKRLHIATKGNMRILKKLLVSAGLNALKRGSNALEELDLHAGFSDTFGAACTSSSPFIVDSDGGHKGGRKSPGKDKGADPC